MYFIILRDLLYTWFDIFWKKLLHKKWMSIPLAKLIKKRDRKEKQLLHGSSYYFLSSYPVWYNIIFLELIVNYA